MPDGGERGRCGDFIARFLGDGKKDISKKKNTHTPQGAELPSQFQKGVL